MSAQPHTPKSLAELAQKHVCELLARQTRDWTDNAPFEDWLACCLLDFLHVAAELSSQEHELVNHAAACLLSDWKPTPAPCSGSSTSIEEPKPEPAKKRSRESALRANYTPPAIS